MYPSIHPFSESTSLPSTGCLSVCANFLFCFLRRHVIKLSNYCLASAPSPCQCPTSMGSQVCSKTESTSPLIMGQFCELRATASCESREREGEEEGEDEEVAPHNHNGKRCLAKRNSNNSNCHLHAPLVQFLTRNSSSSYPWVIPYKVDSSEKLKLM